MGLLEAPEKALATLASDREYSVELPYSIFHFPPIRLVLWALTSSVQKDWPNVTQSSPDLGVLGVLGSRIP